MLCEFNRGYLFNFNAVRVELWASLGVKIFAGPLDHTVEHVEHGNPWNFVEVCWHYFFKSDALSSIYHCSRIFTVVANL